VSVAVIGCIFTVAIVASRLLPSRPARPEGENDAHLHRPKNEHATAHFHATGHPIMRTIEPGESWKWCYVDQVMVD